MDCLLHRFDRVADGPAEQRVLVAGRIEAEDEANLAFMLSMMKSIRPRDSVEAMLVAQMVSVHVMTMRCAQHLARVDDLARHDSATRAFSRLARTFPAQVEALNKSVAVPPPELARPALGLV